MKVLNAIKLLVFFDSFAVSLVVPLLSSYFRDAGADSKFYALISSSYSFAQLFSGVFLAVLLDYVSKRDILLLSFIGSMLSYAIVGISQSTMILLFSRVLVGMVKQTSTVATAVTTSHTQNEFVERASHLGHISTLSTVAFVIGPSLGGLLYKANKMLPALIASLFFAVNVLICILTIPNNKEGIDEFPENIKDVDNDLNAKKDNSGFEDDGRKIDDTDLDCNDSFCLWSCMDISGCTNFSLNRKAEVELLMRPEEIGITSENLKSMKERKRKKEKERLRSRGQSSSGITSFFDHFNELITFPGFAVALAGKLLLSFVEYSMSSRHIINYMETKFSIETYILGFLSSGDMILSVH